MPVLGIMADSDAEASWTPAALPGLELWLDASDIATITNVSGFCSQITDKSGKGRTHVQATAANQPATGTNQINGLNALQFDGVTDHMTYTWPTVNQPLTIASAFKIIVMPAANSRIYGRGTTITNLNLGIATSGYYYAATTGRLGGGTGVSLPHVLVGIFNGASSSMRADGAVVSSADPGTNGFTVAAASIGATVAPASALNFLLGSLIVTSTALAGTDLTKLEAYLKAKWGTP